MSDAITNAINAARGQATAAVSSATSLQSTATAGVNNAISNAVSLASNATTSLTTTASSTLSNAQNTANALMSSANAAVGSATAVAAEAQARAQAALDRANAARDRLNNLPLDRDPQLIEQQIEAEILRKKAEREQKVLFYKENAINMLMEKLDFLKIPSLPIPIKLPIIDPKMLGWRAILMQTKDVVKQRNKTSVANLAKGKELYKYPLRNVSKANLPQLPQIPKVPDLPRLPSVLPSVPRINV